MHTQYNQDKKMYEVYRLTIKFYKQLNVNSEIN